MLEKLTPEQEKLIHIHRDEHIEFVMNNNKYSNGKKLQLQDIKEDINWLYEKSGLEKPKFIFIADSYYEEKLMMNSIIYDGTIWSSLINNQTAKQDTGHIWRQVSDQVKEQVSRQVIGQVIGQVGEQVKEQVDEQVKEQVKEQVSRQVRRQVWEQVWDQVSGQVWEQVKDQVIGQVGEQVWDQVKEQVWDQVSRQVTGHIWRQVDEQVDEQVNEQVDEQVRRQVSRQVWEQVWDQVSGQVWEQVKDQVIGQVIGQVGEQVGEQVKEQVRRQVSRQVSRQVWDQVSRQVTGHIWRQVNEQVKEQVDEQVRRQVCEQVWEQVDEQVKEQVGNQLSEQVKEQVSRQISDQVSDQVEEQVWEKVKEQVTRHIWRKVGKQVRRQVWDQVSGQVWEQVWEKVKEQVKNIVLTEKKQNKMEFIEHYFGVYDIWITFYSYFEKIGILKNDDFNRYYNFIKKGIWSIQFFKHWCIITRMPLQVHRDSENRLHSLEESSVIWSNKQDKNYFIHGVSFSEELWEKVVTQKISMKEILKIQNMEQRNAILSVISPEKLIRELDAKLISTHKQKKKGKEYMDKSFFDKIEHHDIKLYMIKGDILGLNDNIYILLYTDPSTTREYFSFIDPDNAGSAAEAMASKFGLTTKEYMSITAES